MRRLLCAPIFTLLLAGAASAQMSFSPDDFGATPNNPNLDDSVGIQLAINEAVNFVNTMGSDAVVDLSPGTYYCKTRQGGATLDGGCVNTAGIAPAVMFWIGGVPELRTVTIRGSGTMLLCEDNASRMFVVRCNDGTVVLEDFEIDIKTLPYLIGRVQGAVSPSGVVRIRPLDLGGFGTTDILDIPLSEKHWGRLIDPTHPGRPVAGSSNVYRRGDDDLWTVLDQPGGPGTDVFISLQPTQQGLDLIQSPNLFSYQPRAENVFWVGDSTNVQMNNITAYSSGQFFCFGRNLQAFSADGCRVLVKPGRWRSTNGDGIHIVDSKNVDIFNSEFEGLSDDCVAIRNCEFFRVHNNTFTNCNRHAIILDAIHDLTDPASFPVSTNGSFKSNHVTGMGGSALYAQGGAYNTVTESGTTSSGNHLTTATSVMRHVRFRSVNNPALVLNATANGGSWSDFDPLSVALPNGADSPTWDLIRMNLGIAGQAPAHLLLTRGAREDQKWLYATANRSNPTGILRVYGPEEYQNQGLVLRNAADQIWELEETGNGSVVLRHKYSAKVLTAMPAGANLGDGDSVTLRHRYTTSSPQAMNLQEWQLELVED